MFIKTFEKVSKTGKISTHGVYSCDSCGKEKTNLLSQMIKKKRHFCDMQCRGKAGCTPEIKMKMSISHKGYKPSAESIEKSAAGHRGNKHTDETKERIRITNTGKKRSEETLMKMSIAQSKVISEGLKNPGIGINGHYTSAKTSVIEWYSSLYELIYMIILDNDDSVVSWTKKHKITIEYEKPGVGTRSYTPDFKLTMSDGSIKVIETKGYVNDTVQVKFSALESYCLERSWTCELISAKELRVIVPKFFNGDSFSKTYNKFYSSLRT